MNALKLNTIMLGVVSLNALPLNVVGVVGGGKPAEPSYLLDADGFRLLDSEGYVLLCR